MTTDTGELATGEALTATGAIRIGERRRRREAERRAARIAAGLPPEEERRDPRVPVDGVSESSGTAMPGPASPGTSTSGIELPTFTADLGLSRRQVRELIRAHELAVATGQVPVIDADESTESGGGASSETLAGGDGSATGDGSDDGEASASEAPPIEDAVDAEPLEAHAADETAVVEPPRESHETDVLAPVSEDGSDAVGFTTGVEDDDDPAVEVQAGAAAVSAPDEEVEPAVDVAPTGEAMAVESSTAPVGSETTLDTTAPDGSAGELLGEEGGDVAPAEDPEPSVPTRLSLSELRSQAGPLPLAPGESVAVPESAGDAAGVSDGASMVDPEQPNVDDARDARRPVVRTPTAARGVRTLDETGQLTPVLPTLTADLAPVTRTSRRGEPGSDDAVIDVDVPQVQVTGPIEWPDAALASSADEAPASDQASADSDSDSDSSEDRRADDAGLAAQAHSTESAAEASVRDQLRAGEPEDVQEPSANGAEQELLHPATRQAMAVLQPGSSRPIAASRTVATTSRSQGDSVSEVEPDQTLDAAVAQEPADANPPRRSRVRSGPMLVPPVMPLRPVDAEPDSAPAATVGSAPSVNSATVIDVADHRRPGNSWVRTVVTAIVLLVVGLAIGFGLYLVWDAWSGDSGQSGAMSVAAALPTVVPPL